MRPGETVRYACEHCHIVFDLCLAPFSESADGDLHGLEESQEPTSCPFCGAGELRPLHDRPIQLPSGSTG